MTESRVASSFVKVLFSRRMLAALLMGFSSGLPLLLTGSTLQAWMKESQVDLGTIGLMSIVGLPYTLKFVWAPLFDRFSLPFLGRRRGWLLVTQLGLALALVNLAFSSPSAGDPRQALLFSGAALLVTFMSASQDILVDTYRRESLSDEELGLGSSLYVNGYRVGLIAAGAGALLMADHVSWRLTYIGMAALMAIGAVMTLFAGEPPSVKAPRNWREAIVDPILEYFRRPMAWTILAFIVLYKVGESMASAMTMPMYLELGFTKSEVAAVVKGLGFAATIAGGFLGGLWMLKLGIRRSLVLFGVFQSLGLLGFSVLAKMGHSVPALGAAIFTENLSAGMATTAYVAFMASLTNRRFTATQYALLTSLMGVPRVLASVPTGYMAQGLGWSGYFVVCALITLPGIWLAARFKLTGSVEFP